MGERLKLHSLQIKDSSVIPIHIKSQNKPRMTKTRYVYLLILYFLNFIILYILLLSLKIYLLGFNMDIILIIIDLRLFLDSLNNSFSDIILFV